MKQALRKTDPVLFNLIEKEICRQRGGLELIASENITSRSVMECLGSELTNKYSEGLPGRRYYGGNQFIDQIEQLCIDRALEAFKLSSDRWMVNVQPYSGSVANLAVYNALLNPHDRLMGLDLPSGGHLTHGFYTAKKRVSVSSVYYESMPYKINDSGLIDYDQLARDALLFKPKLLICGASAYPRDFDYKRFREIADSCKAYLMADIAHISGLVVTGEMNNPFEYCDVVTTTTHKTLRGPRAGLIFAKQEFRDQINNSVFPGLQGGPHENQIAGVATQLLEVQTPEFHEYIRNVKNNARVLGEELVKYGYKLSSGGTDNHLLLVDLHDHGISGSKAEAICDLVEITINKNSVFGDKSALVPGGIRLGTAALTTRGLDADAFTRVAEFLHQTIQIAIKVQKKSGRKLVDFKREAMANPEVSELRNAVSLFANQWDYV